MCAMQREVRQVCSACVVCMYVGGVVCVRGVLERGLVVRYSVLWLAFRTCGNVRIPI